MRFSLQLHHASWWINHIYGSTLTIIFFLLPILGFSQYSLKGTVNDTNNKGVSFANVLLRDQSDSSLVKGAVTDADGNYSIVNLNQGDYFIESYMVGYNKSYLGVPKFDGRKTFDLTPITITESTLELDEVVVRATKPLYELEMGKMVVNVATSITSSGLSVIDVLERSPGMLIDRQNGGIALNGKDGVIVLINGKRSRMPMAAVYQLLQGMNSGDVEKIEIMTVPPANYDADGDAGFINIVMKNGSGVGTNGSVMGNIGYASGPRAGGSVNITHQTRKISLFGNYSINHTKGVSLWEFNRSSTNSVESTVFKSEAVRDPAINTSQNYQLGADFQVGEKTSIGGLIGGNDNVYQMNSITDSDFDYSVSPDTLLQLQTDEINHWNQKMGSINVRHTFSRDQVLTGVVDYLKYSNSNPSNYSNNYYDAEGNFIRNEEIRVSKDTPIKMWVSKIDYSMKVGSTATIDAGIKGTFVSLINEALVEEKMGGDWEVSDTFSNYADLTEDVLAAYVATSIKIGDKTSANAGLRYEDSKTYMSTLTETGVVDRRYKNFFPTIYLSRKANDNVTIELSYGRRITRPTFNEMAPFVFFVDPYTFFSGNANILPTFTNNIKGDFSYKSFILSVQYSHDKNPIYRFQPKIDPETNMMVLTSENADRRETFSTTITLPIKIADWWEMQNNLSGNIQSVYAHLNSELIHRTLGGVTLNTTQTFNLPDDFTLELSGSYRSPVINGAFNWKASGSVNIGLQKKLSENSIFRFSANDIFETNSLLRWVSDENSANEFHGRAKFEKRVFTVTYTQKFGNSKIKARKRAVGSADEQNRVTN